MAAKFNEHRGLKSVPVVSALVPLLLAIVCTSGLAAAGAVNRSSDPATHYPVRPLRFIAPTSPGGANDLLPRRTSGRGDCARWPLHRPGVSP